MDLTKLNKQQEMLFTEVSYLYNNSRRRIAHWLWENHVTVVTKNAFLLAEKYKANVDYCVAGALLHDFADVWLERMDMYFESKSKSKAELTLKKVGYGPEDISIIVIQVIKPHSCYPGHFPELLEGKILATADALAHLRTDFYPSFKRMGLPETVQPTQFNEWARTKLERDFNSKIFFDDERKVARGDYEKLKKEFSQ